MANKSVALIHNIPSPYRLPVFESLSDHCDLTVYFCTSNHDDRYWEPDLSDYSFNHHFLHSFEIGAFYISASILTHIFRFRPDELIISENPPTLPITILAIIAGKMVGANIVIWNEAWDEEIVQNINIPGPTVFLHMAVYLLSKLIRGYRRVIYSISDSFIAFSSMSATYLTSLGVKESQIVISEQIMPESEIPEVTGSKHISKHFSEDKTSILYMGYIRPRKGIELLLQAFSSIVQDHSIELIIAGKGEERYEQKIRKIGSKIPNVEFVGYVDDEKADCYLNADVCVLPTYRDAWGLVINESLYYGTPVITTEAAAGKSIVCQDGIIIPSGDDIALKNILALCTSPSFLESVTPNTDRRNQVSNPMIMTEAFLKSCSL